MAGGDRGLQAAALFAAVVLGLFLPKGSWAQPTTTTTTFNASNVTAVCHTHCCDTDALRVEARLACQEFRKWGVKDSTCVLWQLNAVRSCQDSCSNCTTISKAMYDQCLFFLQGQMEFTLAMENCRIVEDDFEKLGRCKSVCNTTEAECFSDPGKQCMADCGNFQNCECWKWRGIFGEPDSCSGKTVVEGYIPDVKPPTRYDCTQIGEKCKNHRKGRECGKYKWCKTNMCLVKGVTCPLVDSCQKYGSCETSTGECYYTLREDGVNCTDGLHYTHDDKCAEGKCVGWVDRCLRDEVECGTTNPCLWSNGTCHPVTGACMFVPRADGLACSSAPNIAHDGNCSEGLCRRTILDKCLNKNCTMLAGSCLKQPTCDALTGDCIVGALPEGLACTDANKSTFNDMCIEGQCIGSDFEKPSFKKVADGFCADDGGNMLSRYFADTFDQDECQEQCAEDPACIAYSFGFHLCSIYGGARVAHPSRSLWGQLWVLGNLWGDVGVQAEEAEGVTESFKGRQVVVCMKKVANYRLPVEETPLLHEIVFGCLLTMIVCTPGIWLCLWKLRQPAPEAEGELEGDDYEQDATIVESIKLGADPANDAYAIQDISKDDAPAISPREGNKAAVAMAPAAIEAPEDPENNENNEVSVPGQAALDDDGMRDPRGEVAGK